VSTYLNAIAALQQAVIRRGIHYSLDRMIAPLTSLGSPHLALPPVIHIAGTNGKGSTTTFIAAALQAAGLRVGTYTSPHLLSYCERIAINGTSISELDFSQYLHRVMGVATAEQSSEFEILTMMAFLYFSETPLDVVILETGLGGRLDATNIVTPVISVLTPIGLDHQDILGPDLRSIAIEKAGIIKPGVPAFSARQHPDVAAVLPECIWIDPWDTLPEGYRLNADYQRQNAALARAVVRHFMPGAPSSVIDHGLKNAFIWGRFTELKQGSKTIIIDGAHNSHGIAAVMATMAARYPGPFSLWMGMLRTKNRDAALHYLPDTLASVFSYCPDPERWHCPAEWIWNDCDHLPPFQSETLLITGSLYFIATLRPWFDKLISV